MDMVTREGWTGSDLSARTDVVRYLRQHGGTIEDGTGLAVTQMRSALGKGRALSQLLADMEQDGMIRREIRGRRTFKIELVDDWGLVPKAVPAPVEPERAAPNGHLPVLPTSQEGLEQLADALLAIVVRRATAQPEASSEDRRMRTEHRQLVQRLAAAERSLAKANDQLVGLRTTNRSLTETETELREQVRVLQHNLQTLEIELTKPQRRARGGGQGVSIASRLSEEDRATLATLMQQLPGDVRSRDDGPPKRKRTR